jgi:hypothetical protein
MTAPRYSESELQGFTQAVLNDGYCILRNHFSASTLNSWREAFAPLLEAHIQLEGHLQNRGPARYYVTLPFLTPFSNPQIYEDETVLTVCQRLVGDDMVMCQLASDTPLKGSDYQDVHRDALPLFPETRQETPPFQLAVNFPLVDIVPENGPFEIARGTHMMLKSEGLRQIEAGHIKLEPILMQVGDVMIRDVRGLHRGTPNRTSLPRPMVVIGYSRRWLSRPEVAIRVPRAAVASLSERARRLLRFNPVVESLEDRPEGETYQLFAY